MHRVLSKLLPLTLLGALPLGLALTGSSCAGVQPAEVNDAWFARVPPENMSGVYEARATYRRAEDAVMRAEVARRDAEREAEVARHDKEAAKDRVRADQAALKAARARGQAEGISEAERALSESELALDAAEARVAWREQQIDAREAQKELRERLADVRKAEVSLAEYQALKESGDVRANELSVAEFRESLANAQRRAARQDARVEQELRAVRSAEARWSERQQALQGYGGSGNWR
jgi:colicin import membrane protein